MLVNRQNFEDMAAQLFEECRNEKFVATDTETTALFWWASPWYPIKPRVFSVQFSTAKTNYYFDFGCEESLRDAPETVLNQQHFEALRHLFRMPDLTWFIHNAKFDMHHLANHQIFFWGTVHCTQSVARLVNNLETAFSLDDLSEKYLGAKKVNLDEYFTEESGRVTKIKRPGDNGKYYDFYHFDKLPLDKLVEYGEKDTRLCYDLGKWQLAQLEKQNLKYFLNTPSNFGGNLMRVLANEYQLTKSLFKIERHGVKLDLPFVNEALMHAYKGIRETLAEIDPVAASFVSEFNAKQTKDKDRLETMDWNSAPMLKGLFDNLGLPYAYTEKGNATFDKDALEKSTHPIAAKILEYRRHSKRAHTYLENYIWLADTDGVLHCNFSQGGTQTGRLSCREPNMQNVPKRADKKEADFVLRRCFIPRPGKVLVSLDLDQAEYRMMLDYAREEALINRVLAEGLNVHEATNQELELNDYDEAKTMNFMLLYGGGVPKLAEALYDTTYSLDTLKAIWFLHKWPRWFSRSGYEKDAALVKTLDNDKMLYNLDLMEKAEAKLNTYFEKLPAVQKFVKGVKAKAKDSGIIFTWLGRILRFTNADGEDSSFKAPNALCQGGVGDLGKVSLNAAVDLLDRETPGSYAVLHVHDELLAEVDEAELHIIPALVELLGKCYPHRLVPITAGAAYSRKSWGDLEDGYPC